MKNTLKTLILSLILLPSIALSAPYTFSQGGTNFAGPYASNTVVTSNGTNLYGIATSSLGFPSFADLLNYVTVNTAQTITGTKTFTNFPLVSGVPTTSNQLTNKTYVDSLFTTGSRFVNSATAGTVVPLPANTYNNGASGVGATLTGNVNGALTTQDGVTLTAGQTLLVKDEVTQANNGFYDVTTVGNAGTPYVLTRNTAYDQSAEIVVGTFFNIVNGTVNANRQYIMNNNTTITVGTTAITFALLSASNVYTASQGIALSGFNFFLNLLFNGGLGISGGQVYVDTDNSTIVDPTTNSNKVAVKNKGITALKLANGALDLASTTLIANFLGIGQGGTGLTTTPTNGQLLIGNGTGYTQSTLTAGSNISITNGAGSITIASTGGGGSATTSLGATQINASFISTPQTAQTWTAQPVTDAEIFAATSTTVTTARIRLDLTRGNIYRLVARQLVAGATGATLRLQCSADQTTWTDAGTDGTIDIGALGTQPRTGNWSTLASACKGDVYLRLVGVGGNAVASPSFRELLLQVQLTQPSSGSTATSTVPVSVAATPQTTQAWTNQPIALTELFGNTNGRFRLDTTNASSYRLLVNQSVAGFTNARLFLQCSADNTTFASSSVTSADSLDIGTGTGVKTGAVATLSPSCIGDKYFRIVGQGGNATADPAFRQIQVQFTYTEQALGSASDWQAVGTTAIRPTTTVGILVNSSSTISALTVPNGTTTNSTSTNLFTSNLTVGSLSGFLKATAGVVSTALINLTTDVTGILPLANGGTATSTFTNGGVVFSDGTKLTQDTPSFFWDNTNKRLGLSTTSPVAKLSVNGDVAFRGDTFFATTTIGNATDYLTIGAFNSIAGDIPSFKAVSPAGTTLGNLGQFYSIEDVETNTKPMLALTSADLGVATTFELATSTGIATIQGESLDVQSVSTTTSNVGLDISSGCFAINGVCVGGGAGTDLWTYASPFTQLASTTAVRLKDSLFLTTDSTFAGIAFGDDALGNLSSLLYAPSVKAFFLQDAAEFRITNGNFTVAQGLGSFGTTTTSSVLSATGSSTNSVDILSAFASSTGAMLFTVDKAGMQYTGGDRPTISSCGSGPSIVGNNNAGRVTVGSTGIGVTCTITFADGGWQKTANAPACSLAAEGTQTTPLNPSVSQTQISVNVQSTMSGSTFTYSCKGF